MKVITCDICKKEFGKNVGLKFCSSPKYLESDFDNGFYIGGFKPNNADICLDCWNKIAEAQNKAVEEIINPPVQE
jgi:hypothetical protein